MLTITVGKIIRKVLFPEKCIVCKKFGESICKKCAPVLRNAKPIEETWITSLFSYKDNKVSGLIYQLKYKNKKHVLENIYESCAGKVINWERFQKRDSWVIVPVPTSAQKKRIRGFNQAEIIAEGLARLLPNIEKVELDGITRKDSDSQTKTKNKTERLKNVIGAYRVTNEKLFTGKNILIIDDVLTTGATLNEMRKILKSSGAKDVIAFTVAH